MQISKYIFHHMSSIAKAYYIISYSLFAGADTGIYPHAASQYHARPKAKRGIAMLNVDEFPYPQQQIRGNEFIPCSNNICHILRRFHSFKIPAILQIWPKSPYKHGVTRSYRSSKESGRRSESPLWRHQWRSFVFISHADDVKRGIRLYISRLLTNQKRESALSMGYIYIYIYIYIFIFLVAIAVVSYYAVKLKFFWDATGNVYGFLTSYPMRALSYK